MSPSHSGPRSIQYQPNSVRKVAMSIDTMQRPAVASSETAASRPDGAETDSDPFELDISFIEHGPNADTVIAMTDDGCGSTCPSACTTSASA